MLFYLHFDHPVLIIVCVFLKLLGPVTPVLDALVVVTPNGELSTSEAWRGTTTET